MHQQNPTYHEELIGTLTAISIVSKRLAKNLALLEKQRKPTPKQHCPCRQQYR